jgi:hypothetical protein
MRPPALFCRAPLPPLPGDWTGVRLAQVEVQSEQTKLLPEVHAGTAVAFRRRQ